MATYREHGHALARGVGMDSLMAEMYGKVTGCSRGRGGSMHLFDTGRRFYGGNAIVGGGLPLAVGLALADKMRGIAGVTACFFGDGAVAEGEFHECMNLAALWDLPLLFCCENNLYAMGTALDRAQAETDLAARAGSYGMVSWAVDGMDVIAVEHAARRAAEAVRARRRPALPRAAHLPVPRALDVRPGPLPGQGRDRAVEGTRPDRRADGAAEAGRRAHRPRPRGVREGDRRGDQLRRSTRPTPPRTEPVEDLTQFVYSPRPT